MDEKVRYAAVDAGAEHIGTWRKCRCLGCRRGDAFDFLDALSDAGFDLVHRDIGPE